MSKNQMTASDLAAGDRPSDQIERDWFLQRLVAIVNGCSVGGPGINLPLTVLSGGAAITGQLISHKDYFQRFANIFGGTLRRSGDSEQTATQVTKLFAEMGDFAKIREKLGIPQPDIEPPPQFIHLANASIVHQTGVMPNPESQELSLWRGRIGAVDAFMFGTIGPKRS